MRRLLAMATLGALVIALAWMVQAPSASIAACACTAGDIDQNELCCEHFCAPSVAPYGGCLMRVGSFPLLDSNSTCIGTYEVYECMFGRQFAFLCGTVCNMVPRPDGDGDGGCSSPIFRKDCDPTIG